MNVLIKNTLNMAAAYVTLNELYIHQIKHLKKLLFYCYLMSKRLHFNFLCDSKIKNSIKNELMSFIGVNDKM